PSCKVSEGHRCPKAHRRSASNQSPLVEKWRGKPNICLPGRHSKQGAPGRVRKAINDALATALEVRLLKRYDFDGLGSVILRLNPERCKLLAAKSADIVVTDDECAYA